jgi:hypothetical protein
LPAACRRSPPRRGRAPAPPRPSRQGSPKSPGIRSPRLTYAVFEQTRRHPCLREPAAQAGGGASCDHHDLLVAQLEVDRVPRLQTRAIPQRLGITTCPFAPIRPVIPCEYNSIAQSSSSRRQTTSRCLPWGVTHAYA